MTCGNVVIPFDNTIEKGTDLYNLYNTNIHEKIAQQKDFHPQIWKFYFPSFYHCKNT